MSSQEACQLNTVSSPVDRRTVAIPRLQRTGQGQHTCRAQKMKCSGSKPKCDRCTATGEGCAYIMPRQDRLKSMTERCVQMADVLGRLRQFANAEDGVKIANVLKAIEDETPKVQPATVSWMPETKNYDQLAVEEAYTLEESREDCAGYMDLMPSIARSVANFPPLNTASVDHSNYDAMMADSTISPCDSLWSFNASTCGSQPWYDQGPW